MARSSDRERDSSTPQATLTGDPARIDASRQTADTYGQFVTNVGTEVVDVPNTQPGLDRLGDSSVTATTYYIAQDGSKHTSKDAAIAKNTQLWDAKYPSTPSASFTDPTWYDTHNPDALNTGQVPGSNPTGAGYDSTGKPIRMEGESEEDYLRRGDIYDQEVQRDFQSQLEPITLANNGQMRDPNTGVIRAMTDEEYYANPHLSEAQKTQRKLAVAQSEQDLKYARGEGEIPSYITDAVEQQTKQGLALTSQRLGPGGAYRSTAGINQATNLGANARGIYSSYQTGQSQQGLGLLNNYGSYLNNQANSNYNMYNSNSGSGLLPMSNMANQPYTFGSQLQDNRETLYRNRNSSVGQGLLGGVGSVAGMFLSKGRS